MSAVPHVHHRRHIIVPDPVGNIQEEDARQTEVNLFQAESSLEVMEAFYATIVNGTPNIDANWIASHPAGLREPKNPGQIGITDSNVTSNQFKAPLSPLLMGAKLV